MPVLQLRRLKRSSAAQAAVVGATRALEAAFPIIQDEAMLDRLRNAVAALIQADAAAELQGLPGSA
ncbi:hypothetical protein [Methylobacterium goesingense]|uniref:Uncharacterized protein n=1 Tax=Methylobacterium goesingense TaxID=243690 RepID=A0ABV2L2H5_9HYPH|nr:hypothetical protein [Methylobacterium goesingense]GJD74011.1 hypothetical protein CFIICLFH_2244 [Methylobacterium goesingense]